MYKPSLRDRIYDLYVKYNCNFTVMEWIFIMGVIIIIIL